MSRIQHLAREAAAFHQAVLARMDYGGNAQVFVSDRGPPIEYVRAVHEIGGHAGREDLWYAGFRIEIDTSLPFGMWRFPDEPSVRLN